MTQAKFLYRFQLKHDQDVKSLAPKVSISKLVIPVVKETPGGYWILHPSTGNPKFVHKGAHKSYAYNDVGNAWNNFSRRTAGWEWVTEDTLDFIKRGRQLINEHEKNNTIPQ